MLSSKKIFMISGSSSAKASDPSSHRWASFIGTTIALLTFTIPLLAISYNSSPDNNLPQNSSSLVYQSHSLKE